jgi:S-formylglutathione hydrolase
VLFFSMGGNGTVVIGLRNPETFHCLSLLAPSCNPTSWGRDMIFKKLLGDNEETWADYDASVVTKKYDGPYREILLDQVRYSSKHQIM